MSKHNRDRRLHRKARRGRTPIVGFLPVRRVGHVDRVPPGYELGSCDHCEAPVWVDPRRLAYIKRIGFEPVLVCDGCDGRPFGAPELPVDRPSSAAG